MGNKKGFTLLEILIVISIIGLLLIVIIPQIGGVREDSRDTVRKSNLSNIALAIEAYRSANKKLPASGCLKVNTTTTCNSSTPTTACFNEYYKKGVAPDDPLDQEVGAGCNGYYYVKLNSGQSIAYLLLAKMEKEENNNAKFSSAKDISTVSEVQTSINETGTVGNGYDVFAISF